MSGLEQRGDLNSFLKASFYPLMLRIDCEGPKVDLGRPVMKLLQECRQEMIVKYIIMFDPVYPYLCK